MSRNHHRRSFPSLLICVLLATQGCSGTNDEPSWRTHYKEGLLLEKKEEGTGTALFEKAVAESSKQEISQKEKADLYFWLAHSQYESGKLNEAYDNYMYVSKLASALKDNAQEAAALKFAGLAKRYLFWWGWNTKIDPSICERALKLEQGDPKVPTQFNATVYQTACDLNFAVGDYANAQKYNDLALNVCRQLSKRYLINDLNVTRSLLMLRKGDVKEATRLLTGAISNDPVGEVNFVKHFGVGLKKLQSEGLDISKEAETLLSKKDFDGLEKLSERLQLDKKPDSAGNSKMSQFYMALDLGQQSSEKDYAERITTVNEWITTKPNSSVAKIMLARLLFSYAWLARGTGYANTVTEEGSRLMQERLEKGRQILAQCKNKPPEWYMTAQRVALGQGWPRADYDKLVNECRSKYPFFDGILLKKVYWLEPRWYGEPGELDEFIADETKRRPGVEGDIFYARATESRDYISRTEMVKDPAFDWEKMKRGLTVLAKQYPQAANISGSLLSYAILKHDKNEISALQSGKL